MRRAQLLICCALLLPGCWRARVRSSIVQRQTDARRCQFALLDVAGLHAPPAPVDRDQIQRVLGLPPAHRLVGRVALGAEIPLPEQDRPASWEALAQQVSRRAPRLQMEVTAGRMVTDCQGNQVVDLRDETLRAQGDQQLRWSAGSIAVAGLGALGAGIVDLSKDGSQASPIISIASGIGSAALAVGALRVPAAPMHLKHEHNSLRAIWIGRDEDHLFPDFVWRMLQIPASPDMPSSRDLLIGQWKRLLDEHAGSGDERREWEALLFGSGGSYSLEQLQLREVFFAQLETEVQSLHQAIYLVSEYAALQGDSLK